MVKLLPRLNRLQVEDVHANGGLWTDIHDQRASYAASGGHKVSIEELVQLRNEVVELAKRFGMPKRGSSESRSKFDTETAILLAQHELLKPPEALRDDSWAFLSTVMLRDVVIWRFGSEERISRFLGGVRNALQRLWLRATILDRGTQDSDYRWQLVRTLTEDAFVQIVERPSIASDKQLAIALAEGWIRTSKRVGNKNMEDIMRKATVMIRLQNQVQLLSGLDKDELDTQVDEVFRRAEGS